MNEETEKWANLYVQEIKKREKEVREKLNYTYLLNILLLSIIAILLFYIFTFQTGQFGNGCYSFLCADTDKNLTEFARDYTKGTFGIKSADKLSYWIYHNISYRECGGFRKATETYYSKQGVCRDKAILLISFMESLGYKSTKYSTNNGGHAIAKIYDTEGYFYCDPTKRNPFAIECYTNFDCSDGYTCDKITERCINGKSKSFCWRPY